MINQEVIKNILWLIYLFKANPLVIIGGVFTIYFAIQKLSKKVAISYSMSSSRLYDTHIPALIISNKRDNAIAISSIEAKVNLNLRITLIKFDSPLVLKAYDTVKVDLPHYSNIYHNEVEFKFEPFDKIDFYLNETSGKSIHCHIESSFNIQSDSERTTIHTVKYEDLVITEKYGFVFTYYENGEKKNLVIDRAGMFHNDNPFPFNHMKINEITKDNFKGLLLNYGIHDYLENYLLVEIKPNLSTEVILTKSLVTREAIK